MRSRSKSLSRAGREPWKERLRSSALTAFSLGLAACGSSSSGSSPGEESASKLPVTGTTSSSASKSASTDAPASTAETSAQPKARPGDPLCAGVAEGGACGPRGSCRGGVCVPMRCGDGMRAPHEQCDDGNLRSGDGCSMHCQVEYCGDGIRQEAREACDDGRFAPLGPCNASCILRASCGDARLDPYEECDDGNALALDGCSPQCTRESAVPQCGNGRIDAGEQCDDGNLSGNDGCTARCLREYCGDGIVQSWEGCDDGNRSNDDGCTNRCALPTRKCGNGRLDPQEECDDGNYFNEDDCPNDCLLPRCGDGIREGREGCDDGNQRNDDGCSASCRPEFDCGDGQLEPGEQCDDANQENFDDCPNDCQYPRCGDGVLEGRERCEPQISGKLCSPECEWVPLCGDGVRTPPEECDDGNREAGDGCSADCRSELCGNGIVEEGEACDDGNRIADDGCSECQHDWLNAECSACVVESCPLERQQRCKQSDSECLAVLDCYFEKDCITGSNLGTIPCFCGDAPRVACLDPALEPAPNGPCLEPIVKSLGTRLATRVIELFYNSDFGAGRANGVGICMARKCREACLPEKCDPAEPSTCDDGLVCTRSRCSQARTCVHEPLPEGELCPTGRCSQGKCVQCLQDSDCATAEVADRCHEAPRCEEQRCVQGAALVCEQDDNPCTQASCDLQAGCQAQNLADGTPCAEGRNCRAGRCEAVDGTKLKEVVIPVGFQGAEGSTTAVILAPWYRPYNTVSTRFLGGELFIDDVAFHCFDLSEVSGSIVGAQLRIVHPPRSYRGEPEQQRIIYRSLSAPLTCERLADKSEPPEKSPKLQVTVSVQFKHPSPEVQLFGELIVDRSINQAEGETEAKISVVDLSAAAVASLNRYRGGAAAWPVALYLFPQKGYISRVFAGSTPDAPNQLVLQVQEP